MYTVYVHGQCVMQITHASSAIDNLDGLGGYPDGDGKTRQYIVLGMLQTNTHHTTMKEQTVGGKGTRVN